MASLWMFVVVGGPVVLGAVLLFAWLRNRAQPASEVRASEEGARELRDELDRDSVG